MSQDHAIRIDGLVKNFRGVKAVDGLSMDVPRGSIFGLLGENGAGKTTTLQVLLGLLAPDGGRAEVLGLDPSREGLAVRRRTGYVPEVPALYDWMTPAEIGWFAAGFHADAKGDSSTYQARYLELIRGFELPPHRKIKTLSKGMRAKVSLSLAIAAGPELLILDEPTSGLDVMVRREFLESMVDVAAEGRTVLLSSHQIGEVERVASHVALMHKGRLLLAEPLDQLRSRTFLLAMTFSGREHPLGPPSHLPMELIDCADAARQAHWLVRARDRGACELVRGLAGVESLEIQSPGLEEIYIGYMRGRRGTSETTSTAGSQVA